MLVRAGAAEAGLRVVETERGRDDDPALRFQPRHPECGHGKAGGGGRRRHRLRARGRDQSIPGAGRVRIHLALGDNDRGLALLEQSIRGGAVPIFYKDEPAFAPLRSNPRFRALLKEMRIPD